MKQILKYSSAMLGMLGVSVPVLAADVLKLPTPPPTNTSQSITASSVVSIITTGVNYLITVSVVIAVGMFVYGGIRYAMGDAKATDILKRAALGLLAILGVGLLINTISGLIQRGLGLG